jgi:hypothetical protein
MAPKAVSWPLGSSNALLPTPLSCHAYARSQRCCCIQPTIASMKAATWSTVYLSARHVHSHAPL